MPSDRQPRCRMLDRHRNPSTGVQLTDFGLCLRHLREAAGEWQRVISDAVAQFPDLSRILSGDDE